MKTNHNRSLSLGKVTIASLLAVSSVTSSQAINVVLSGTSQEGNQPLINFINNNFQSVNLTFGDYSNPANIPVGTDLFIVGRILSSGAYDNAANSTTFNSLGIPVVSFTSFVTRTAGSRWAWESGGTQGASIAGDETTVTSAGANVFGAAGNFDWWTTGTSGTGFNAAGSGTVGTGEILASIGGLNLVVGWKPGDTSAGGVTFSANRLLFNLPDSSPNPPSEVVLPDTLVGQQALISALTAYTPLIVAVPEPSTFALAGLGALVGVMIKRRQLR